MDFGISFLTNNLMLPILDFFYGVVPSYGLSIIALTLVVRVALYPVNAGQIRNMRRMKVAQPVMQKRIKEIQERYKADPAKQQEEMAKIYQEFGNPLAGCLPLLLQMPVLFALFATLRGSPFADIPYTLDLEILPAEQAAQIQPKAFSASPHNIYVAPGIHYEVTATLAGGNRLAVGESTALEFRTADGRPLTDILAEYPEHPPIPAWNIKAGSDLVKLEDQEGETTLAALAPGKVSLEGIIPGLAARDGFLFIQALGRVGAVDSDGTIHWDTLILILVFGASTYLNQVISGSGSPSANPQQDQVNRYFPLIFTSLFLFFPLPAGVLMYMVVANLFQTGQAFILSREPLPENLQKLVDTQDKSAKEAQPIAFDRSRPKKKA